MDYSALFPGRFLKSVEFQGRDVTLTVRAIRLEELPQDAGGTKTKGIVAFVETKKELVLNRTNAESIRAMFGRETDAWIGKRVTFWPAPYTDSFTGEVGTAIRVRGSPDLTQDMDAEIRLPRKKPSRLKLKRTTKGAKQAAPPPPSEPPEDMLLPGEPPFGSEQ